MGKIKKWHNMVIFCKKKGIQFVNCNNVFVSWLKEENFNFNSIVIFQICSRNSIRMFSFKQILKIGICDKVPQQTKYSTRQKALTGFTDLDDFFNASFDVRSTFNRLSLEHFKLSTSWSSCFCFCKKTIWYPQTD